MNEINHILDFNKKKIYTRLIDSFMDAIRNNLYLGVKELKDLYIHGGNLSIIEDGINNGLDKKIKEDLFIDRIILFTQSYDFNTYIVCKIIIEKDNKTYTITDKVNLHETYHFNYAYI